MNNNLQLLCARVPLNNLNAYIYVCGVHISAYLRIETCNNVNGAFCSAASN